MPFNLPLKDMSLHEKLSAMESLWEDLARTPEAIESPAWHKDVLDERLNASPTDHLDSSIGKPRKPASATSSRDNRSLERGPSATNTLPSVT